MFGWPAPADVGLHGVALQPAPQLGFAPHGKRPFDCRDQHIRRDRCKMEASGDAGSERHLVGIDHRVAKATDMSDDGQSTVAHRAELRQAARFKA